MSLPHLLLDFAGVLFAVGWPLAGLAATCLWHRAYRGVCRRRHPGVPPFPVRPGFAAFQVALGWVGLLVAAWQLALDPDLD